jgi:hypothetical protein
VTEELFSWTDGANTIKVERLVLGELGIQIEGNGVILTTLAAECLIAVLKDERPGDRPSRVFMERAATDVFVAAWRMVQNGQVDARSPLGDALLNLRDALNPDWPNNANWLPAAL